MGLWRKGAPIQHVLEGVPVPRIRDISIELDAKQPAVFVDAVGVFSAQDDDGKVSRFHLVGLQLLPKKMENGKPAAAVVDRWVMFADDAEKLAREIISRIEKCSEEASGDEPGAPDQG